jgi:hypothetical protein
MSSVIAGLLVSCVAVPVIVPASPVSAAPADCGTPTTGALADYFDNAVPGHLSGVPISFRILLALPILVLLMAAGALVLTVRFWRGSGAGLAARIHQIVAFTGLAALTWFFYQWNLLGWQF